MNTNTIILRRILRSLAASACLLISAARPAAAQTPSPAAAAPAGQNYIKTRSYIDESGDSFVTDAEYYDGLGYLVQRQNSDATPFGGTVVLPIVYDNMHRADATAYLPYAGDNFAIGYRSNAVSEQAQWYGSRFGGDRWAYSLTDYESGEGGRPISVMRPGREYRDAGRSTAIGYSLNEAADSVRVLGFDRDDFRILPDGWYPAGSLQRVTSTDEDGRAGAVFSDASGKTVLARRYDGPQGSGRRVDTYYVYDVRDSLVCVIQPEGVPHMEESMAKSPDGLSLDAEFLDRWCFTWRYDAWGNVVESHVPGGATYRFRYDDRDRVVYMDDGQSGIRRDYDSMDRLTGEYFETKSSDGNTSGSAFSRQIHYYDNHGSHIPEGRSLEFRPNTVATAAMVSNERCLTKPSCEIVFETPILSDLQNPYLMQGWVDRAYYYNSDGRLIQTVEHSSDGWDSSYSIRYDFAGNIVLTLETHEPPAGTEDRLLTEYIRDSRGRVTECTVTLNGERTGAVEYTYDELGRPDGKAFLCPVEDFAELYKHAEETTSRNLQGWVTETRQFIDDSLMFDMVLDYFGKLPGTTPQYTGLVSGVTYARGTDSTGVDRYAYAYDALGRLAGAGHLDSAGAELATDTEKGIVYDMNGNILALTRRGHDTAGSPEVLGYTYDGNRLVSISSTAEAGADSMPDEDSDSTSCTVYSYVTDANGRVTFDGHQGLHITYNLLNLPQSITTNDGVTTEYIYLSDGTKIYAGDTSDEGCGTCYRGSFVYAKSTVPSPADGSPDDVFTLQSVATPEGRVMVNEDGSLVNLWYAKDYLGSVRSVVSLSGTPQILEQNDYLPFGMRIDNPSQPTLASSRWRYAGKEEQASLVGGGCDLLDFGFRSYDPWAARWTTPDPLAAMLQSASPYNYCINNPTKYVDPFGLWIHDDNGMLIEEKGDNAQSLAQFLGISEEEAQKIIDSGAYKKLTDDINPAYCSATRNDNQSSAGGFIGGVGMMVAMGSEVADHFGGYTFYFDPSKSRTSKKPFYSWKSGWKKGNQYIPNSKIKSVKPIAKGLKGASYILNVYITMSDLNYLNQIGLGSNESFIVMTDLIFDAIGFIPGASSISVVYNLVGRESFIALSEYNQYCFENDLPMHVFDD